MIDPDKKPPFKAYTLTKAGEVKEVEIVSKPWSFGFRSKSNAAYVFTALFDSIDDAVVVGRECLEKRRIKIEKQIANLAKYQANLEKYEAAK